ncbi:MAG: hypothetical protein IBJ14_05745 [Hydrogenophaga sp.]|nr:hypothetical protein [Hydrogenophaga sp.]
MRDLAILDRTMKSIWMGTLAMLTAGASLANPERVRDSREPAHESAAVMPISIDGGEPRAPMRLRDALRQPFDDMDDGAKPFRLSVEERQRLREQLRGQPPFESSRKP